MANKEEKTKKYESIRGKIKPIKKDKINKITEIDERKKRDVIKGKSRGFPLVYGILIIAVVAVIGWLVISNISPVPYSTGPVKEGDFVQIRYTGSLDSGDIFDSGNLTFNAGAGKVITGMDEAVIGMRLGESKSVRMEPEKAYGYYDPTLIMDIPLVQELERTEVTTLDVFMLSFGEDPVIDKLYTVEGMQWSIRVVSIQNQTVTMMHEPEDGLVFDLTDGLGNVYGTSKVSVIGDKMVLASSPIKGSIVVTVMGAGKITDVNEENMTMDLNHELAGEALNFDITVLNFISY